MRRSVVLLFILFLVSIHCKKAETLVNEADGTIRGNVIAGEAAGKTGFIHVVATHTNAQDEIDWSRNSATLNTFSAYEIEELVAGKYYLVIHLDENRDNTRDPGEPWGGYDSNGDERLDPVTLIGGKTVDVDLSFFSNY